ncbi:hypothetical protein JOY44_06055 [Phormidium sp. CLA17]|uniref:hypothetical protein n=1 Tax=Leptolyngbya sp. Cla-17 TaxID=2803751 RepID=UPI0014909F79|nr:hypothetical protein [Leptolyngbya sp. Cla-17]MBM0741185.1 hypothetical protein [Leptolyngbya sp. Cla-17]
MANLKIEMFTPQESTETLIKNIDVEIDSAARYAMNLRQTIVLLEDLQANFAQPLLVEQLAVFRRNLAIAEKQIVEMEMRKNTLIEKSEQANSNQNLSPSVAYRVNNFPVFSAKTDPTELQEAAQ